MRSFIRFLKSKGFFSKIFVTDSVIYVFIKHSTALTANMAIFNATIMLFNGYLVFGQRREIPVQDFYEGRLWEMVYKTPKN